MMEDRRLKEVYGHSIDSEKRTLARAVKLSEEVGELSTEILAFNSLQRKEKLENHSQESLAEEFADVIITTLLLARSVDVDIGEALAGKIEKIKARNY